MIDGMTTTKIAVSLPVDQVAEARRAVAEGRIASVSAWIAQALASQNERQGLRKYLNELIAEFGSPALADYNWADEQLDKLRTTPERK